VNRFDVSVHAIRRRAGRHRPFEVRWQAAGRSRSKSFTTKKLADSYRAELVRAARMGLEFDPLTGEPTEWHIPEPAVTWHEEATAYATSLLVHTGRPGRVFRRPAMRLGRKWSACWWVISTASASSRALAGATMPGSTTAVKPSFSRRKHEWPSRVSSRGRFGGVAAGAVAAAAVPGRDVAAAATATARAQSPAEQQGQRPPGHLTALVLERRGRRRQPHILGQQADDAADVARRVGRGQLPYQLPLRRQAGRGRRLTVRRARRLPRQGGPPALERASHRIGRGLEDARGLGPAEAEHVTQHDDGALAGRQQLQRRDERQGDRLGGLVPCLRSRLGAGQLIEQQVWIRFEPGHVAEPGRLGRIGPGLRAVHRHPPATGAQGIEAAAGGNPVEPGADRGPFFEAPEPAPGGQQRLLERVLGVLGGAEDPVAVNLQLVPVRVDKLPERFLVAGPGPGRQVRRCFTRRRTVLAAWLLLLIVALGTARVAGGAFNSSLSLPSTDSQAAVSLLTQHYPAAAGETDQAVIQATGGTTVRSPQVRGPVTRALAKVAAVPGIASVASPHAAAGAAQVSRSGTAAFARVTWDKQPDQVTAADAGALIAAAESADGPGVHVSLGGASITNSERAKPGPSVAGGVIAALAVLLVVFGGTLLSALTPLAGAALALVIGSSAITLLSHGLTVASASTDLAVLIGLGVGVDYGLFVAGWGRCQLLWSWSRPSRMKSSAYANSAASSHAPRAPPWVTARAISTT
jgi:hypothetical protein